MEHEQAEPFAEVDDASLELGLADRVGRGAGAAFEALAAEAAFVAGAACAALSGAVFAGAVITESVFAWNGIGYNQWMPITKTGARPRFHSVSQWQFNATTGEWRVEFWRVPNDCAATEAKAKEAGADYDLKIASEMVRREIGRLVTMSPPSRHAAVVFLGDLFHQNDQKNVSVRSSTRA